MAIKCITNSLLILFRERNKSWLRLPARQAGQPREPAHLVDVSCTEFVHWWQMSETSRQRCPRALIALGSVDVFSLPSRIRTPKRQDHHPRTAPEDLPTSLQHPLCPHHPGDDHGQRFSLFQHQEPESEVSRSHFPLGSCFLDRQTSWTKYASIA